MRVLSELGHWSQRIRTLCHKATAALILVFVVGVFFDFESPHVLGGGRIAVVFEASAKGSLPDENSLGVPVFNSSYQIQPMTTSKNILDLHSTEDAVTNCPGNCDAAWQDRISSKPSYSDGSHNRFVIRRPLREILSVRENKRLIIDPGNARIGVSDIYKIESDFERPSSLPCCLICEPSMFQTHTGAVTGSKFVTAEFQRFERQSCLSITDDDQNSGKQRNDSGADRRHPFIVSEEFKPAPNYRMERGALMFCSICTMLGALYYAWRNA